MRELVFEIEYEPGSNRVADTLAEYPEPQIRPPSLHATSESLRRVDHVIGAADALADIEAAFLDRDLYTDCLTPGNCGATHRTEVLESADEILVLYSYWDRAESCASVLHLALARLGQGRSSKQPNTSAGNPWGIVHSGEGDVRAFFNDLEESVGEAVSIDFQRLREASSAVGTTTGSDDLFPEQEAAFQAAVAHGYYETPREIDVGGLADDVDVPRWTLNHRLRRAEEHLAKQRVARMHSRQRPSASD